MHRALLPLFVLVLLAPTVVTAAQRTADARWDASRAIAPRHPRPARTGAVPNRTNTSLLMKLKPESSREAGASSTFTRLTQPTAPSASMSRFVNSPSPDQPEVSTCTTRW